MAGESYDRAYGAMVSVQMLSELEEIIQYKLVPERREIIKQMWWDRLHVRLTQRIGKGESGLFLTPVLTILGGSHFDGHVWKLVIVPLDFA